MKHGKLFFAFTGIILLLTKCKPDSEDSTFHAKVDSTYAMLMDLKYQEIKITNNTFEDAKITAAIQAYANAKTTDERISIMDAVRRDIIKTDVTTDLPASKQQGLDFITQFNRITPERFDLAIQNNDVVVQQIKLMNAHFNDLDTGTINAIGVYEKLSKEDKVKFLGEPDAFKPVPDYIQRYLGREFQRTYYFQRYLAMERLNKYLLQKRFINEFPQGFKQLRDIGQKETNYQFDLKLAKK